jgi:hypothetical protein
MNRQKYIFTKIVSKHNGIYRYRYMPSKVVHLHLFLYSLRYLFLNSRLISKKLLYFTE